MLGVAYWQVAYKEYTEHQDKGIFHNEFVENSQGLVTTSLIVFAIASVILDIAAIKWNKVTNVFCVLEAIYWVVYSFVPLA